MSGLTIQAEVKVLETLADSSPQHVMEIADVADTHPITIDQTCSHLHDEGYIYPLGRGLYKITKEGEQRLEAKSNS
jgi:predicted transcriptional regulator